MFKWFWPGVTWTAALTALALWFGADRVETDIATRTGEALTPLYGPVSTSMVATSR